MLLLLCISFVLISDIATAVEHDSLYCEKSGDCPEASNIVLKLHKRDDEFAKKIAAEHEMFVKGRPFLDSHYFVEYTSSALSQQQKLLTIASLNDHPDVISVIEERPQIRVKRGLLHESDKQNPNEFLKPTVGKRTNGTDYRGIPSNLDEFLNIALGQTKVCKLSIKD